MPAWWRRWNGRFTGNGGRVSSQMYHDAFIEYRFAESSAGRGLAGLLEDTQVQFKVRNVFNTRPPFVGREGQRFISAFGDPRLASYALSLTRSFGN